MPCGTQYGGRCARAALQTVNVNLMHNGLVLMSGDRPDLLDLVLVGSIAGLRIQRLLGRHHHATGQRPASDADGSPEGSAASQGGRSRTKMFCLDCWDANNVRNMNFHAACWNKWHCLESVMMSEV